MAVFYPTDEYNNISPIKREDGSIMSDEEIKVIKDDNNKWGDRFNLDHVVSIMFDSGNYYLVMDTGYKHRITAVDMAAINDLISSNTLNIDKTISDMVEGLVGAKDENGDFIGGENSLVGRIDKSLTTLTDKLTGEGGLTEQLMGSFNQLTENIKTSLNDGLKPLSDLNGTLADGTTPGSLASITEAINNLGGKIESALTTIVNKLNDLDTRVTRAQSTADDAKQIAQDADSAWIDFGSGVKDRVEELEDKMSDVEQKNTSQDQDINSLNTRVTVLENA